MNIIDGRFTAIDGKLRFESNGVPSLSLTHNGTAVRSQHGKFGIRPEDLVLGDDGWPVAVSVAEQHGASSYIHGTLPNGEPILIHQQGQIAVSRGDVLHVTPAPAKWHVFDNAGQRVEV
jgi:multiple sugar transport system ATP-binding protein